MANLAKSNAIWLRFWTRFLFILGIFRSLDFVLRRFGDEKRTLLVLKNDPRSNFGGVATLVGAHVREDTTEAGDVIVRVTGGSDPRTVTYYKATGGGAGDRICAGTANAGATAALAELNGSGCSGTYKIAGSVTADTDDLHRFFVQQDHRLDATNVFSGTDDDGEDARSLQSVQNAFDRIESLLRDARQECANLLFAFMVSDGLNVRAAGSKFLKDTFTTLLAENPGTPDGSGLVAPVRTGALPAFTQAMADEASGSTQTIRRRYVQAAAATPDVNNDFQGTIGAHTPEAQMPTGTIVLRAVNAKEQGFPTGALREQWSVEFASDVDDRTIRFSNLATVGAAWKGELGAGGAQGFTIERTFTKTNDSGNDTLAAVTSGFSATGESLRNTGSGILYFELDRDGVTANYAVLVYKGDSRETAELVAQSPAVAANAAFTATAVDGSGLDVRHTLGDAPADGATCEVDCNFASSLNATGRPDELRIAVTLTDEGEASRLLARMPILNGNGFRLNGVASAELVDDDLVKANTYPDVYGGSTAA